MQDAMRSPFLSKRINYIITCKDQNIAKG